MAIELPICLGMSVTTERPLEKGENGGGGSRTPVREDVSLVSTCLVCDLISLQKLPKQDHLAAIQEFVSKGRSPGGLFLLARVY